MKHFFLILFLLTTITMGQDPKHSIIPVPVNYEATNAEFVFDSQVILDVKTNNKQVKRYVKQFQQFLAGGNIKTTLKTVHHQSLKNKVINISLHQTPVAELGKEGYIIEVNKSMIKLSANQGAGIFNGFQTLRRSPKRRFMRRRHRWPEPILSATCQRFINLDICGFGTATQASGSFRLATIDDGFGKRSTRPSRVGVRSPSIQRPIPVTSCQLAERPVRPKRSR